MKFSINVRATLIVLVPLLSSSCGIMHQSKYPISGSSRSAVPAVNIIPITAKKLQEISQKEVKPAPESNTPDLIIDWEYQIGPGDVLSIVVWDHPQLTIPAGPQRTPQEAGNLVSPSGTIFYPYIGTLAVAGETISEVRSAITDGLKSIIPNPQLDVSIARFSSQQVHVAGSITSPGAVAITNIPITVMDALELREGALLDADLERIKLVRGNTEYLINLKTYLRAGNTKSNPQLRGGDLLIIPRLKNNEVYVLGEVNNPGIVPMEDRALSLTAALASREGINKTTANAKGVFVFRSSDSEQQIDVFQLNISNPAALLLGTRFALNKGDVVYATSAPATRWNRIISNLIPSLGIVNTLLLLDDRT